MSRAVARSNGDISFWYAGTGEPTRRPPLDGDRSADVCIVGGGFTGLWAAYYLKKERPELDIVIIEREFCGFGASGRNGGWLSARFATPRADLVASHGEAAARAHERAMKETVDEVIAVCRAESIDADIVQSGVLVVARGSVQAERLSGHLAVEREWGVGPEDLVALDGDALKARIRVTRAVCGAWNRQGARVHPAKLVQGLAAVVEQMGVTIYESTAVHRLSSGVATSDRGTVKAPIVLRCTEGFTASLAGQRRKLLPLNSAMVVTAPLPPDVWAELGWQGEQLLGDVAHAYMYAQRTADGRIAFGGRGVPYRFGSRVDRRGQTQDATIRQLGRLMHEFFPATAGIPIDHAWCGVLGVARDWASSASFDRASGLGAAGGYVGNGVGTANLAGRTLRDMVLGRDTMLTRLPWVNHQARGWEPEPLRWVGARLVYWLYRAADRRELRSGKGPSVLAKVAGQVSGR